MKMTFSDSKKKLQTRMKESRLVTAKKPLDSVHPDWVLYLSEHLTDSILFCMHECENTLIDPATVHQ